MLSTEALNTYDQPGMQSAAGAIERARAVQDRGSRAKQCLEAALGVIEMREGDVGKALHHLTEVYRASNTAALAAVQVEAACPLGVPMRQTGDFDAALSLNAKKMDWDAAHRDSLALSTSTYLQGETLNAMRNFRGAITTSGERARSACRLGIRKVWRSRIWKICQAEIDLGELASARLHCERAAPLLAAAGTTDMLKETWSLLAPRRTSRTRPGSSQQGAGTQRRGHGGARGRARLPDAS